MDFGIAVYTGHNKVSKLYTYHGISFTVYNTIRDVLSDVFNVFESEITEFLVIVTQAARGKDEKPYDVKCRPDQNFVTQTIPFVEWKSSDWDSLQQNLVQIQTKMLRRDAKVSIGDIREGAENKEIDPLRSVSRADTGAKH